MPKTFVGILIARNCTISSLNFQKIYHKANDAPHLWLRPRYSANSGALHLRPKIATCTDYHTLGFDFPSIIGRIAPFSLVSPTNHVIHRLCSSSAPASCICFILYATTVALARDARWRQVETVYIRLQVYITYMPPRTRFSLPVRSLHAHHGACSSEIICDTRTVAVYPLDENQDDRSVGILIRFVRCLECTPSASARP